jgi:hypothetical protein
MPGAARFEAVVRESGGWFGVAAIQFCFAAGPGG